MSDRGTLAALREAFLAGVRRGASDGTEGYPMVADDYLDSRGRDTPPGLDVERLAAAIRANWYEIRPHEGEWVSPSKAAAAIAREYAALSTGTPKEPTND